jgi:hypothetical protein
MEVISVDPHRQAYEYVPGALRVHALDLEKMECSSDLKPQYPAAKPVSTLVCDASEGLVHLELQRCTRIGGVGRKEVHSKLPRLEDAE